MKDLPYEQKLKKLDALIRSFRHESANLAVRAQTLNVANLTHHAYYRDKTYEHLANAVREFDEAISYLSFLRNPKKIATKPPSEMNRKEHKEYMSAHAADDDPIDLID